MGGMCIFALDSSRAFGEAVCRCLGTGLSSHEERDFEDGEHKARPLENVRGRDVFVIQSLYGDSRFSVDDKLCRLLFFIGALVDASAQRVTAVIPYLAYGRKEQKSQTRDPVTTRYVARLFESVGTDRVVTMDVHNLAAFQNAYRCRTDHLEAGALFAGHFTEHLKGQALVVVSPDAGGVKRAERLRQALVRAAGEDVPLAFMEKHRSGGVVRGQMLVGDVSNRAAVIVDDLISTGGTIARAAFACRQRGARAVYAAATHGLFTEGAEKTLGAAVLDRLVVANTVPPFRLSESLVRSRLAVLDVAPLFAEAIRAIHEGGSISSLLE